MHHSVPSYPPIKLEAFPAPGITFDYNYNYNYAPSLNNNTSSHLSSAITSNAATTTSVSSPSPSATSTSTGTMAQKRPHDDSDCEDLFTDKDGCITPPGSDAGGGGGGHNVSRKKRRGIIEKRRRDRINNSLSELRRLVPTAFEKQGSAKLEKAEILQMTVDHLKMLHAKGLDALAYDPHKFAMDYHCIGFRECSAEVARYLVGTEGMDTQDPLRLRLISHLQCLAAQRELANKQASASSWGLNALTPNHSYSLTPTHHLPGSGHSANSGGLPIATPLQPAAQHPTTLMDGSPSNHHQNYLNTSSSSSGSGSSSHTSPAMGHDVLVNHQGHHLQMGQRTLFPPPHNHHQLSQMPTREYQVSSSNPPPMTSGPYGMPNHQNYPVQSGKPYRPWGAELAY